MDINDKRTEEWKIEIGNKQCPFIMYPNNDVSCKILFGNNIDNYFCCKENCPLIKKA